MWSAYRLFEAEAVLRDVPWRKQVPALLRSLANSALSLANSSGFLTKTQTIAPTACLWVRPLESYKFDMQPLPPPQKNTGTAGKVSNAWNSRALAYRKIGEHWAQNLKILPWHLIFHLKTLVLFLQHTTLLIFMGLNVLRSAWNFRWKSHWACALCTLLKKKSSKFSKKLLILRRPNILK